MQKAQVHPNCLERNFQCIVKEAVLPQSVEQFSPRSNYKQAPVDCFALTISFFPSPYMHTHHQLGIKCRHSERELVATEQREFSTISGIKIANYCVESFKKLDEIDLYYG